MWIRCIFLLACLGTLAVCQEDTLIMPVTVRLGFSATLPCRLSTNEVNDNVNVRWQSVKQSWLTAGTRVYKFKVRWYSTRHKWLTTGTQLYQFRDRIEVVKTTQNEWNLKINNVDQYFADVYTCTGNNRNISIITLKIEGILCSQNCDIHKVAPKIDQDASSPSEVSFKEFEVAEIKCVFTGEPTPEVTWYRGWGKTKKAIKGLKGDILRIREIPRYATGAYTCRGENSVNNFEHVINVTVEFPPEVQVYEDVVYAAEGAETIMMCMVQGYPVYDVYWIDYKNEQIKYDNHWKYEVTPTKLAGRPVQFVRLMLRKKTWGSHAYGNYTCEARGQDVTERKIVQLLKIANKPAVQSVEYKVTT